MAAVPSHPASGADRALVEAFAEAVDRLAAKGHAGAALPMTPSPSPRAALERLYATLPLRFPPLFEMLVLARRWPDADAGTFRLLANPPGRTLGGLHGSIFARDKLAAILLRTGFLQFGLGPGKSQDPVCFATARRRQGGDCPVVQLAHDDLAKGRVRAVRELAPSFRHLMEDVVRAAGAAPPRPAAAGGGTAPRPRPVPRRR